MLLRRDILIFSPFKNAFSCKINYEAICILNGLARNGCNVDKSNYFLTITCEHKHDLITLSIARKPSRHKSYAPRSGCLCLSNVWTCLLLKYLPWQSCTQLEFSNLDSFKKRLNRFRNIYSDRTSLTRNFLIKTLV